MRSLFCALALAAAACTSGPPAPDDSNYAESVRAWWAEREQAFRETDDPIPAEKKDLLLPLPLYEPDPKYAVPAELKLSGKRIVVEMPTSTGTIRSMELIGNLEFTLEGQRMSLGALVPAGTSQIRDLFVPFADLTTGKETYFAGRYLDIPPTASGFYTIDFNKAYNPTCAYNDAYECPYPPPSNRLKVAVRAGEKAPVDDTPGA
jgi:uncharacterized protein (DUF1684 family)